MFCLVYTSYSVSYLHHAKVWQSIFGFILLITPFQANNAGQTSPADLFNIVLHFLLHWTVLVGGNYFDLLRDVEKYWIFAAVNHEEWRWGLRLDLPQTQATSTQLFVCINLMKIHWTVACDINLKLSAFRATWWKTLALASKEQCHELINSTT